jgi:hypothetical protein
MAFKRYIAHVHEKKYTNWRWQVQAKRPLIGQMGESSSIFAKAGSLLFSNLLCQLYYNFDQEVVKQFSMVWLCSKLPELSFTL